MKRGLRITQKNEEVGGVLNDLKQAVKPLEESKSNITPISSYHTKVYTKPRHECCHLASLFQ